MATTDIKPAGPTSGAGAWTVSGNSNPAACVGTQGDNQLIYIDNYNSYGDSCIFYSFGLGSLPTYIAISGLTGYYYATRNATQAGTLRQAWSLGGAYTNGAQQTPIGGYLSDSMGRPGGGTWTRADLSSLLVKYYAYGDAANDTKQIRVDEMIIRVTWAYITPSVVQTDAATAVDGSSATLNATLNPNGDAGGTYRIVYGTSSGSYDAPGFAAVSGGGSQTKTRGLTGLNAGTTYYYRVEYKNSGGTQTNGSELTFTTASTVGGLILFF